MTWEPLLALLGGPLSLAWLAHRVVRRPDRHIRAVAQAPDCGRPRVLCLGASIVHGNLSYPWVDEAHRRLQDQALLINAGRNGSLAYNTRKRLPHGLALRPRLVVVLVGTNDAVSTLSAQQAATFVRLMRLPRQPDLGWYRENLTAIVSTSRAAGAEVALVTLPPLGEDLASRENERLALYNQVIRAVAAEHSAHLLDLHTPLARALAGRPAPARPGPYRGLSNVIHVAARRHLLGLTHDAISARRGLHLTTDGVHLNERSGAVLVALVTDWVAARLADDVRSPS
jgi:acyl-CoA thioesterase-1